MTIDVQLHEFTTVYKTKSKYQDIAILQDAHYGKILVLDNLIQSAQSDEYVYHEALVHPALICHPCPKSVFIGGGGEGATAREVLKHKTVEKCVMVDLDEEVVEACKKYLPEWSDGAFSDPRLKVVFSDCRDYLEKTNEKYDVMILDLADPCDDGPCVQLYFREFYELCKSRLNPDGLIVTQSGLGGKDNFTWTFSPIYATLRSIFPYTAAYSVGVISFEDYYGFSIGSLKYSPKELSKEEIDKRIKERTERGLRFYCARSHETMTNLLPEVAHGLEKEKRIIDASSYKKFVETMPLRERVSAKCTIL